MMHCDDGLPLGSDGVTSPFSLFSTEELLNLPLLLLLLSPPLLT